jgi:hypothetical protein
VITVARTGPASAISWKKRTNASAVQTTASPTIDATTLASGTCVGKLNTAIGT